MTDNWRTIFLCGLVAVCASAIGFVVTFLYFPPESMDIASGDLASESAGDGGVDLPDGVSATRLGLDIVEKTATDTYGELESRVRDRLAEGRNPDPATEEIIASLPVEVWTPAEPATGDAGGSEDGALESQSAATELNDDGQSGLTTEPSILAGVQNPKPKPSSDEVLQQLVEDILIDDPAEENATPPAEPAMGQVAALGQPGTEPDVAPLESSGLTPIAPPLTGDTETQTSNDADAEASVAALQRAEDVAAQRERLHSYPASETALAMVGLPSRPSSETESVAGARLPVLAMLDQRAVLEREDFRPAFFAGQPSETNDADSADSLAQSIPLPANAPALDRALPEATELALAETGISTNAPAAFDRTPPVIGELPIPPTRESASGSVLSDTIHVAAVEPSQPVIRDVGSQLMAALPIPNSQIRNEQAAQPRESEMVANAEAPSVAASLSKSVLLRSLPQSRPRLAVVDLAAPDRAKVVAEDIVPAPASPESASRLIAGMPEKRVSPGGTAPLDIAGLDDAAPVLTDEVAALAPDREVARPIIEPTGVAPIEDDTDEFLDILALPRNLPEQDRGARLAFEQSLAKTIDPSNVPIVGKPDAGTPAIDATVAPLPTVSRAGDEAIEATEIARPTAVSTPASPEARQTAVDALPPIPDRIETAAVAPAPVAPVISRVETLAPTPTIAERPIPNVATDPDDRNPAIETAAALLRPVRRTDDADLVETRIAEPSGVPTPALPETGQTVVDALPPLPERTVIAAVSPEVIEPVASRVEIRAGTPTIADSPIATFSTDVDAQTPAIEAVVAPLNPARRNDDVDLVDIKIAEPTETQTPAPPQTGQVMVDGLPAVPERIETAAVSPAQMDRAEQNAVTAELPDPVVRQAGRKANRAGPSIVRNRAEPQTDDVAGDNESAARRGSNIIKVQPAASASPEPQAETPPPPEGATESELAALRELVDLQRRQINTQSLDVAEREQRIAALEDATKTLATTAQRPAAATADDNAGPDGGPVGEAAALAPPVTAADLPPPPMFIQGSGFRKYADARELQRQLMQFGPAEISAELIDGRTTYRVRVGPIYDSEYAENLLGEVADAGHQDLKIVIE